MMMQGYERVVLLEESEKDCWTTIVALSLETFVIVLLKRLGN